MTHIINQRWLKHLCGDAPRAIFDPRQHHAEAVEQCDARPFVETHHYSASWPAARLSVALYRKRGPIWTSELVGVAVFSVGVQRKAAGKYLPGCQPADLVELGRFVLHQDVERDGETWLLGQAWRELRRWLPDVRAVLSYSDPLVRLREDGTQLVAGHIGTIYQAHNGKYLGRSTPRTIYLDREGRTVSGRMMSKITGEERGWRYACEELHRLTGLARRSGESGESYLARCRKRLRKVRHPGNHVYAWGLARGVEYAPQLPYPKRSLA